MAKELKHIQIRLKKNEPDYFIDWARNQENVSDSIRRLIRNHVERHGTGDIDSPSVQLTMAQDLLTLNGTQVPVSVPKTVVESEEVEAPKEEEKETVPAMKEEIATEKKTKKKAASQDHDASAWE